MLILGIDTSTNTGTFSLYDTEIGVIGEITTNIKKTHSETALKSIDMLFNFTNKKKEEIDKIIVSIGPGSFTGIRIGVAIAKGLAFALNKKIAGINELDILANNYNGNKKVVSLIDARKERVFYGVYEKFNEKFKNIREYGADDLKTVLDSLDKNEDFVFIGDGAISYKNIITEHLKERAIFLDKSFNIQRASVMIELGVDKEDNLFLLEPYYISKSQAEREKEDKKL